jgi:hypothetical protein
MAKKLKSIAKAVNKEQQEAVAMIDDMMKDSEEFYRPLRKKWNTFEYLYVKGSSKKNTPRGRANLELPLAFQQIEPFTDHMSELMFSETPYIPYRGRTKDDQEPAENVTNYTQWQLEAGEFYPEWKGYIRNLGKFGNGVMKIAWEEDVVERDLDPEEFEYNQETGEVVDTTKTETLFDGPRFYNLSLFEFIIPKGVSHCDVQRMPWVAHKVYRTVEELLDNPNYKKGHAKLKKLYRGKDDNESASDKSIPEDTTKVNKSKEAGLALYSSTDLPRDKHQGQLLVVEWWGDYKFKDSASPEPALIVTVYNADNEEPIILRMGRNPFKYKFKPFVMAYDYRIEGEAYGYGELNHIKGLISESTALRNARLDRTNVSLNSMWLVERQAGLNLRELYTAPDKIVLCDDKDGIERIDFKGSSQASVEELSRLEYDIQNTTEIINPKQDVSHVGAAFGKTATGINYLASRSKLRLVVKARILQYTFIKPLARILLWYNREFVTDDMNFTVTEDKNNPFRTVDPRWFLNDVDFVPESSPIKVTKAERQENLSYMLQVVAQIEGVVPGTTDFSALLLESWKLSGYPHPEKFVKEPGPTMIVQTPDGQLLDERGQPVEVIPYEQLAGPGKGGPSE